VADVSGTQAVLDNYNVTKTNGTLTVGKASITVKADDKTKTYGEANPTFTGTITGVKNNDAITASYSTAATASSNVGTYPIVADVSGTQAVLDNYNVTRTNGTLTVGKAALTVKADDKTKTYGEANPTFTGTLTGVKNGDAITANYSTTATQQSGAGTYPIVADVSGTQARTRQLQRHQDQRHAHRRQGRPHGQGRRQEPRVRRSEPDLHGHAHGRQERRRHNRSYSSSATASSNVGTYPIVADVSGTQAVLDNYNVTKTNGTLTVGKAALTVKADDKSREYGAANPTFTGTLTGVKNGDAITANYSPPPRSRVVRAPTP
jgi:hypothetical protein